MKLNKIFCLAISIFISSCHFRKNDQEKPKFNPYYLNNEELSKFIFGKIIFDAKGGPYDLGISFYNNGSAYINNASGQNISDVTIKNDAVCVVDFKKICFKIGISNGKFFKKYVGSQKDIKILITWKRIDYRR